MQEIGAHVPSESKIGAIIVTSLNVQSLNDRRIFEFLDFGLGEWWRDRGMLWECLRNKRREKGELEARDTTGKQNPWFFLESRTPLASNRHSLQEKDSFPTRALILTLSMDIYARESGKVKYMTSSKSNSISVLFGLISSTATRPTL